MPTTDRQAALALRHLIGWLRVMGDGHPWARMVLDELARATAPNANHCPCSCEANCDPQGFCCDPHRHCGRCDAIIYTSNDPGECHRCSPEF